MSNWPDNQFEDFSSEDLFLRLEFIAGSLGEFKEEDLDTLSQGATSIGLDIKEAAKGYFARDFETVTISVDSANTERPYDIIGLVKFFTFEVRIIGQNKVIVLRQN